MPHAAVILIGLRASGKTTVGRRLADLTRRRFVELDDLTARHAGHPGAGDALRALGEPAFREHESAALSGVLASLNADDPIVLALGGGTPLAPGASDALRQAQRSGQAVILYLFAPVEHLLGRLFSNPGDRPHLSARELSDEVAALFRQRHPLYESLADYTVISRHDDPANTAQAVVGVLAAADEPRG